MTSKERIAALNRLFILLEGAQETATAVIKGARYDDDVSNILLGTYSGFGKSLHSAKVYTKRLMEAERGES